MKTNPLFIKYFLTLFSVCAVLVGTIFLSGCSKDDPKKEDVPELITKATITFTPSGTGTPIVVTATDPDGEGVQNIATDGPINLAKNTTYIMTIKLINGLAQVGQDGYDVSGEVETEGIEHQFFFSWTNDAFSNPAGNGNVDNRTDLVNYTGGSNSKDVNNRPLGLTTTWTTSAATSSGGTFRVLLKHQPDLKSDTSDSNTGETDLDVSFTINIQ
jgi:hypothetical protein